MLSTGTDDRGGDEHHDDDDGITLHCLLSNTISDWGFVYHYIHRNPHKAKERYYRHESPLQLALKARERHISNGEQEVTDDEEPIGRIHVLQALTDADPASIHSRDEEGKCHMCMVSIIKGCHPSSKLTQLCILQLSKGVPPFILHVQLVDLVTSCCG